MPQSAYQLTMPPGTPGLMLDSGRYQDDVVTVIAGAIIPPGVFCEILVVSGNRLLFPLKDAAASTFPTLVGVSLFDSLAAEQTYPVYAVPNVGGGSSWAGYPIGFPVPVMTRGRIWCQWDGSTATALPAVGMGALQVVHSTTGANPQGVVTTKATSATAGFEIDPLPASVTYYDPRGLAGTYTDPWGATRSIIPMSVNLPGHV